MPTFTIDGRTVPVEAGRTLLDACRAQGIFVPTLCHQDGLTPAGGCRLCLVEAKGLPLPVPACSTRPFPGMVVATHTPRLRDHRRHTLELHFASGHHVCAFCPASGRCELQELARRLGLDHLGLAPPRAAPALDASRPRFGLDPGRCVLCTRCVRACAEREGARTLGVSGRGAGSRIAADGGRWGDAASCTDCGKCVEACPTGALFEKAVAAQGLRPRREREPAPAPGPLPPAERRVRVATAWLGGCSGCHMSLLDLDERLLTLAPRMELVHSPLCDAKEYPEEVELCLVEGAAATEDHLALLARIRSRTRVLAAMGDCAGSGNVTAMRDGLGGAAAVAGRHAEGIDAGSAGPRDARVLPAMLPRVLPVHEVVPVDLQLPGCPPPADLLHHALAELLAGRRPALPGLCRLG